MGKNSILFPLELSHRIRKSINQENRLSSWGLQLSVHHFIPITTVILKSIRRNVFIHNQA